MYFFFCGFRRPACPCLYSLQEGKLQVSTVQAALALCLLVIAVSLYDFAVIKSWKGIVEHLTWGDYIGIVVFCISSACIPDSRAADMAGDCKYNSMILNAGVIFPYLFL